MATAARKNSTKEVREILLTALALDFYNAEIEADFRGTLRQFCKFITTLVMCRKATFNSFIDRIIVIKLSYDAIILISELLSCVGIAYLKRLGHNITNRTASEKYLLCFEALQDHRKKLRSEGVGYDSSLIIAVDLFINSSLPSSNDRNPVAFYCFNDTYSQNSEEFKDYQITILSDALEQATYSKLLTHFTKRLIGRKGPLTLRLSHVAHLIQMTVIKSAKNIIKDYVPDCEITLNVDDSTLASSYISQNSPVIVLNWFGIRTINQLINVFIEDCCPSSFYSGYADSFLNGEDLAAAAAEVIFKGRLSHDNTYQKESLPTLVVRLTPKPRKVKDLILDATIYFSLLHETAHLKNVPTSDDPERQEMEADAWAVTELVKLLKKRGYEHTISLAYSKANKETRTNVFNSAMFPISVVDAAVSAGIVCILVDEMLANPRMTETHEPRLEHLLQIKRDYYGLERNLDSAKLVNFVKTVKEMLISLEGQEEVI